MAPPFHIDALLGGLGAEVMDVAFGLGPENDLGSVSGTVTFNPNANLIGNTPGVGTITCSPSGNLTGAIISAGVRERQRVLIINEHASNTITFAAAGTSNVLGGTGVVIPAASAVLFVWDTHNTTWAPVFSAASSTFAGLITANAGLTVAGGELTLYSAASVAYGATMALVVASPVITVAASNTTSATATINCAAVAPANQLLVIVTTTDSSGTCTVTFGTHFKTTATQATTASHVSTISFLGDGTNWNEIGRATAM